LAAGNKIISITSIIETGFALPPIATFKDKLLPEQKEYLFATPIIQRALSSAIENYSNRRFN